MSVPAGPRSTLGLIGYGAFGRLTARHLSPWFEILAHDPAATDDGGVARLTDLETAAGCPVVVLAVPVGVLPETLAALAPSLQPGTLVLDVGSVKVGPARLMAEALPTGVQVVGTHPLFGPQSAAGGIKGLRIAVCPVRGDRIARRVAAFCRHALGLKVFLVSPEDHDREAATVQGLTHLIARVLLSMEPLPTRLTTASFERILQAVEMVRHDSPAVFRAIERDNPYAAEVRARFFDLADQARAELED
ncbi:prephenate dehydrogenase [Brevundimonas sp. LM2]|uniref:prephenate dehydrogenase/arogenate dehydrogenase family protein n=1 Tax=Brevundimonas sp. LM2 TaxID=1938605 RepID=UPI000983D5FB|nr:prephenate dehydrogenase/arogenate dehydrogenase family protein [Brevundimonas sp. LM2]AQR62877.1 prephenate dehydrogenase [Brevundimonas sp. LM2]